jgi:hypothetical protein
MSSYLGGVRERLVDFVRRAGDLARSPWVAYPAIALFQLKVLWGAWIYRDLTQGDTASYFQQAILWHQYGQVDIIWSPLYTAFYGWFYGITGDVYAATVLHRVFIVILVTLLVLALFRRLFSSGIAWLAAAWWAVIPFNFDVFEVHLFAILPLVAAPLAVLAWPSPRGRGIALAIMAGAAVLVRNEMAVVAALLAVLFLVWEARYAAQFEQGAPYSSRAYGMAYGVSLAVAGALVLFFFTRSVIPLSLLQKAYEPKHTINMCQAYAFGYKQRHPEWTKDHWTECSDVMQARFGEPYPSLWTMIRRNPRAVLGHFAWNLRLLPNGLQLSLFGTMSGNVTPDYNPVPVRRRRSLVESGLLMALIAAGVVTRTRERGVLGQSPSGRRFIGWLALAPAAVVVLLLIVPTQRPRPEYLYGLSLPIVAVGAWAADALLRRRGLLDDVSFWTPIAMVLPFLAYGTYFTPPPGQAAARPLLETIRRLEPYHDRISAPGTVFLTGQHAFSLGGYMVSPRVEPPPRVLGNEVLSRLGDTEPVEAFLERFGVNLFYLDEGVSAKLRSNLLHRTFLDSLGANGWRTLASEWAGADEWLLIGRHRTVNP